MSQFPIYNFNDPDLDYDAVQVTNKQMLRYLNAQGMVACCKPVPVENVLTQARNIMYAADLDKVAPDEVRYKADVKSAYLLMYPLT